MEKESSKTIIHHNLTNENGSNPDSNESEFQFTQDLSLESIRKLHNKFVTERNWEQYHSPRNIMMAMVGEIGEIAELFQWRNDSDCQVGLHSWTDEQRNALGEELSDVLIYLTRLADRCHIDLPKAVLDKMKKNEEKYPIDKVFGSSKKYNMY
ncbi:hypothetical protein RDWZM_004435 [Blomia tropicalis]|uniref:dCTP pyrophosphatase 1 n=1 Tax=Blomia tropicalis TaxID=40697 RepID=A0A9Q0ML55_BLOTA|nr:hypothetical protein RDWZM_004435 [Blomia tropicalis]